MHRQWPGQAQRNRWLPTSSDRLATRSQSLCLLGGMLASKSEMVGQGHEREKSRERKAIGRQENE